MNRIITNLICTIYRVSTCGIKSLDSVTYMGGMWGSMLAQSASAQKMILCYNSFNIVTNSAKLGIIHIYIVCDVFTKF